MTRPKVDPDKRQRTANACDSCKRRKQKCDGKKPCSTCDKKHFTCTYNTTDHTHDGISPTQPLAKRRIKESDVSTRPGSLNTGRSPSVITYLPEVFPSLQSYRPRVTTPSIGDAARSIGFFPHRADLKPEIKVQSDRASTSGGDEEADNHTMTRMLEDGTGRLVYMGDASTLSFLQLLRMIVETTVGPSPFTMDPERHKIKEIPFSLPSDTELTHLLPDRQTALILVDSFFVNTHALVEVFDEKEFLKKMDRCYSDPLTVDHIFLCHLNLVFAIGLSFATPEPGSLEAEIIDTLRANHPDQSEIFFLHAKGINNPIIGFEDADLWSIQALLLMALYMLMKSRRNPAFAYIGMAVRTAYTLGLHREETLVVFPAEQQSARRNLWRSLFILDRFISASLGRPMAIADEECSGEVLNPSSSLYSAPQLDPHQYCRAGLEAAVRSCHVVGVILKKVYLQRKISTRLAQDLADQCKSWPENLSPALHWRQASRQDRRQAIAILHSNQVYCHSIILLTRPFFLYLLSAEIQQTRLGASQQPQRSRGRMEKFSDACLIASTHTVALVQNAYEGQYLPKINPFVTYCLFAAALIIFSNEFARPASSSALTRQCIANSISIMSYFGEMDPQAKRSAHILIEFRNVVTRHGKSPAFQLQTPAHQTPLSNLTPGLDVQTIPPVFNSGFAPMLPLPGATSAPSETPAPASDKAANPLDTATLGQASMPRKDSFSGLLDLTNTVLPSRSDDHSSGTEEFIDFDSLWTWPGSTPTPSPGLGTVGDVPARNGNGNGIQGFPGGGLVGTPLFEQV
ncbi:MAG: hypothetical protein ALECFALPRED_003918 [Alectoria fallacina]|uniref:Zn(2)-C6 fungal-type domain-containing protein n=1 Tax=Alectoria fallacina TaxID=1903189 RepID=A0A8H3FQ77_9LECA|nr:MAG: hypothetical protein ALECFALPRED_003918 [Alectoria fallacina]